MIDDTFKKNHPELCVAGNGSAEEPEPAPGLDMMYPEAHRLVCELEAMARTEEQEAGSLQSAASNMQVTARLLRDAHQEISRLVAGNSSFRRRVKALAELAREVAGALGVATRIDDECTMFGELSLSNLIESVRRRDLVRAGAGGPALLDTQSAFSSRAMNLVRGILGMAQDASDIEVFTRLRALLVEAGRAEELRKEQEQILSGELNGGVIGVVMHRTKTVRGKNMAMHVNGEDARLINGCDNDCVFRLSVTAYSPVPDDGGQRG